MLTATSPYVWRRRVGSWTLLLALRTDVKPHNPRASFSLHETPGNQRRVYLNPLRNLSAHIPRSQISQRAVS